MAHMRSEHVSEHIDIIRKLYKEDPETAHANEDILLEDFVRAVGSRDFISPAAMFECAHLIIVLLLDDPDRPRYYA